LELNQATLENWRLFFEQVSTVIGTPISQSVSGETIFSVRDAGFADNDKRARGPNTRKKLSFHTDRCDVIGFLCLQQAKSGGENQLVSSPALFNEILKERPDLLRLLMQPYRYLRHTVDAANDLPFTEQPIFSFFEGYFAANFLRVLIDRADADPALPDMTASQKEALDFLETVAAKPEMHHTFRQQPGDMLFMNNWVTMHRRTAFVDHESLEKRRHILRVWLSMPNSRPLDPMFAGNYGATAAGAIRGGIQAARAS
ncbi:MAG: TauD/TfdA family dioxygenase, partial [Pirellulaceae bacterium]|nr:TauD/TfdA family dioxygenase [Pirellulaceae bacterium]